VFNVTVVVAVAVAAVGKIFIPRSILNLFSLTPFDE
jgi:hypothetical protein